LWSGVGGSGLRARRVAFAGRWHESWVQSQASHARSLVRVCAEVNGVLSE
jgi:hypothetical protein